MIEETNNIKKICSFYVNEWHLVTMILPYINKKIEENKKIIVISENNLTKYVEQIISKLSLNKDITEKIYNINMNNKKTDKVETAEFIFVIGSGEYIEKINYEIKNVLHDKEVTVINCFEVMQFNENMKEILDKHEKVLNTSGEREIYEIFEGYKKVI